MDIKYYLKILKPYLMNRVLFIISIYIKFNNNKIKN